jgi:hypothetical protein
LNCGQGAGIKDTGSYGYFENNTLYANQFGIACFEKNIGAGGGKADVTNAIIANSRISPVLTGDRSEMNLSYSLYNTDTLPGANHFQGNPLFLNNLRLAEGSPAINTGDPSFPPDPDGSLPDMGARPYDKDDQQNLIINEIHYHPAEGDQYAFVEIANAGLSSKADIPNGTEKPLILGIVVLWQLSHKVSSTPGTGPSSLSMN